LEKMICTPMGDIYFSLIFFSDLLTMEKNFLLYLLYITLVELRERSYEQNDKRTFWLCDLLHNVPLALSSEESTQEVYNELIQNVHALGIEEWLETRKKEFTERYPQFNGDSNG